MKSFSCWSISLMVALLACTVAAFAAVPQTISYQGYLTDSNNKPASGTIKLTFSLYSSPSGVGAAWNSNEGGQPGGARVSVTPKNGIYSVELGASPQPPLPAFDRPYWLGVQAGDDPEMRPLQFLTSVPYALRTGCIPGDMVSCYTGPPGTLDPITLTSGICKAGRRTCPPDGGGYGICIGEVTPVPLTGCNEPSCSDAVKNLDETDIDCGGAVCPSCQNGKACLTHGDCLSVYCKAGFCAAATCFDGVKNGYETDLDCGGMCTQKCSDGKTCNGGSDCLSGVCTGSVCQAPSCFDNVKNGTETAVDCGGLCPNKCALGKACTSGNDCASAHCAGNICVACTTATDCGISSTCTTYTCTNNTCGATFAAIGTRTPDQSAGDCRVNQCDGSGTIVSVADNADLPPASGNPCVSALCNNGNPSYVNQSTGTVVAPASCSNGTLTQATTCDGSGNAVGGSSLTCSPYTSCASSTACATSCSSDANCISGDYCDSNGHCVAKLTQGAVCTTSSSCTSGFCVDGVCCGSSCTATCMACNLQGSIGTCSNIPNGQDPASECAGASTCNGAGACQ